MRFREGQKRIHQDDVREAVDASAVVSGEAADDEASRSEQATTLLPTNREIRAPQIRRERMSRPSSSVPANAARGRLQSIGEIDVRGILRSNPRRENCAEGEDGYQHDSDAASGCGERRGGAAQLPVAECGCALWPSGLSSVCAVGVCRLLLLSVGTLPPSPSVYYNQYVSENFPPNIFKGIDLEANIERVGVSSQKAPA